MFFSLRYYKLLLKRGHEFLNKINTFLNFLGNVKIDKMVAWAKVLKVSKKPLCMVEEVLNNTSLSSMTKRTKNKIELACLNKSRHSFKVLMKLKELLWKDGEQMQD